MKKYTKTIVTLCLVLALALAAVPCAGAVGENDFIITGYTVISPASITKSGAAAKITVKLRSVAAIAEETAVDALFVANDSFSNGSVACATENHSDYTLSFENLRYTGIGNTLSFVMIVDGVKKAMTTSVSACVPYVEPSYVPDYSTPEPLAEPRAYFTVDALPAPIAADESAKLKVSIKNMGSTTMTDPILNVTTSDCLMLSDGKTSYALTSIGAGKTATVEIPVTALSKVTSQVQSVDFTLSFSYYNYISTVTGNQTGHVIVPAAVTKEQTVTPVEPGTVIDSPVPMLILSSYDFGGEPVAAGSEMTLAFEFRNTSKRLAVENVLLTVSGGADLLINGSTNTFYFDRIGAGKGESVTVPFKAPLKVSGTTQDVVLNFSYEYVDNKTRRTTSSELHISVPLYQPDRLEFSAPVVPYVGFVGEEVSLTLDYVNRGKSEVSNVEAVVSGDVSSSNPFIRVGNIESGKSGTIAFAVAPVMDGDNCVTITVTYEDANGDQKERTFDTILTPMPMEDWGGEWDEPIEDDPVDAVPTFPWWIVIVAVVVIAAAVIIIVSVKKKKAKAAKEKAMWDAWEAEELKDEEDAK